jgi:hypothetical protein
MVGAYRHLEYRVPNFGSLWALWASTFEPGITYSGEDVAFCRRWRAIGGKIWLHAGVILKHIGDHVYVPDSVAK